jgi:hypothetical protein
VSFFDWILKIRPGTLGCVSFFLNLF